MDTKTDKTSAPQNPIGTPPAQPVVVPPAEPQTPSVAPETGGMATPGVGLPPQSHDDIPVPQEVGYTESKSNKLMIVFTVVMVLILFSLVGLFFYRQFTSLTPSKTSVTPTKVPVEVTNTPVPVQDDTDLDAVEIPNIDTELKEIDADLKELQ